MIHLEHLPYVARTGLRLADAQLFMKALRTAGIVSQIEASRDDAGAQRPAPAAPARPPIAQRPPLEPQRPVPAPQRPAKPQRRVRPSWLWAVPSFPRLTHVLLQNKY